MARKKKLPTGKVVGFVRDHARCSQDAQLKSMKTHEITDVHVDGDKTGGTMPLIWWDFKKFLSYVKPSDTAALHKVIVLDTGGHRQRRRPIMLKNFAALEARCARILELSTGLDNLSKASRDKMRDRAVDELAKSAVHDDAGRPPNPLSAKEREAIALHWRSAEHATDKAASDAIRAMGCKRLTPSVLIKRAGKSGRPYATKSKPRKK